MFLPIRYITIILLWLIPTVCRTQTDIERMVKGRFDADSIEDMLLIYAHRDSAVSIAKLYLGTIFDQYTETATFPGTFGSYTINGRSDNRYDSLSIQDSLVTWRTCIAPQFTNEYSVVTFTFKFQNTCNCLLLQHYSEEFHESPQSDFFVHIELDTTDFTDKLLKHAFSVQDWLGTDRFYSYQNIRIPPAKMAYWKAKAAEYKQAENNETFQKYRDILENIVYYYPEQFSLYKEIADYCWDKGYTSESVVYYEKYLQSCIRFHSKVVDSRLIHNRIREATHTR